MFILTKISDTVPIVPADFEKRTRQALEDNLNEKFANKVIQQVGLCICVYDIIKASDGLIDARTSDGTVHVNVTFRMIVFRPFKGEVIQGRIRSILKDGIMISISFFDDITASPQNLFTNTQYDGSIEHEPVFVWIQDGQNLYFDNGETIRFKVEEELWQDQGLNTKQEAHSETAAAKAAKGIERNDGEGAAKTPAEIERMKAQHAPWRLFVSMQQGGLGVLNWW